MSNVRSTFRKEKDSAGLNKAQLQVGASTWSQNIRRAIILVAVCLAGVAIVLVSETTRDSSISLSDQNEFETEPVRTLV